MSVNPLDVGSVRTESECAATPAGVRTAHDRSHLGGTLGRVLRLPIPKARMIDLEHATGHRRNRRGLRVILLGMRGFPNVQGGVEKHAEKLADALSNLGCEIEAVVRSDYVPKGTTKWRNIRIVRLWNLRAKGVEAFVHTFLGVLYAAWRRPDILHIQGIGPAIFTPLARAFGLRVVVTCHSLNYEHAKWGAFARTILRIGECLGMRFSQARIAVSGELARKMSGAYSVSVNAIPNGLDKPAPIQPRNVLRAFGLSPSRYALTVARIDEAKRQLDLIAAYAGIRNPEFKLALVGEADHFGRYARAVHDAARGTAGVVLLGRQTGEALAELYAHAGVFVLPSSHEGQPIAVLEATSYGLPSILSDLPAHREIAAPQARYFSVGDIAGLRQELVRFFAAPLLARIAAEDRLSLLAKHDWNDIARRTLAVYSAAEKQTNRQPRCKEPAGGH
jgi:glycosyltransferase involved in cell wall biosynthesis